MSSVEFNKVIESLGDVDWFGNFVLSGGRLLTETEEQLLGMSITMIFVHKVNQRIVNESDAEYLVIAGSGYFHRGGNDQIETISVEAGSVVRIPRGTPYWDVPKEGEGLLMISINHPPYDPKKIQSLEKN
ncbi:MAG: hypothetical protein WAV40_04365 [Microgenomates group bacterium]